MVTDILTTAITEGTGRGLGVTGMPSAGKTGTTNDNKDGWFAGYTRYYTTGVWVGYDMPAELPGLSGSTYPGAIWHTFMEQCHSGLTPAEFLPYVDMDPYEKIRNDALEEEEDAEGTDGDETDGEENPEMD